MWCHLGFILGPLGAILGPSWAPLWPSWGPLGPSWGHPGPSWGLLGATLGPSWPSLGPSWATLGPPWRPHGPPWRHLGPCLAHLGPTWSLWGLLLGSLGRFWAPFCAMLKIIVLKNDRIWSDSRVSQYGYSTEIIDGHRGTVSGIDELDWHSLSVTGLTL